MQVAIGSGLNSVAIGSNGQAVAVTSNGGLLVFNNQGQVAQKFEWANTHQIPYFHVLAWRGAAHTGVAQRLDPGSAIRWRPFIATFGKNRISQSIIQT